MSSSGIMLTDLDGTLLNSARKVSQRNFETFATLEAKRIVRVAATGRSLYSSRRVLPDNFPLDYLIFSSGAGVMNWKTGEILRACKLEQPDIHGVAEFFLERNLDFSIHQPIPDTHKFHWYASSSPNPDFLERLSLFENYAQTGDYRTICSATQLLAVTDSHQEIIAELQRRFNNLNIIRTTSPLNGQVVWVEVFPAEVSKGHAGAWLCDLLGIEHRLSMCIGNDYNDLAMLEWAGTAFIMANGPAELRRRFNNAPHHDEDGFAAAVETWLKSL